MEERARPARRGRLAILVLVLALLAVGSAAALSKRRVLAELYLLDALERAGVSEASLRVESLGPSSARIRDLRLGPEGELAGDAVELRYSLPTVLFTGRLGEARLRGLEIRARLEGSDLAPGPLAALLESGGAGLPAAETLSVSEGVLELETARGPARFLFEADAEAPEGEPIAARTRFELAFEPWQATGRAELSIEAASLVGDVHLDAKTPTLRLGELALEATELSLRAELERDADGLRVELPPFPFSLEPSLGGTKRRVEGETPRFRLALAEDAEADGEETPPWHLSSAGGSLRLAEAELSLVGLAFELDLDPAQRFPEGRLVVSEVRDARRPARFVPLGLKAELEPSPGGALFAAELADAGRRLVFEARGTLDDSLGRGWSSLGLEPLRLDPGSPGIVALFPALAPYARRLHGGFQGLGEIAWGETGVGARLDLEVEGASLEGPLGGFSGAHGRVALRGPWPLSTPPAQELTLEAVDAGLPLGPGRVAFRLRPDRVLDLQEVELAFAGGTARGSALLDPKATDPQLWLDVEQAELASLLAQVGLEGLAGSGSLSGALPLHRGEAGLEIREARLEATPPGGEIRYAPGTALAGLVAERPELAVPLRALREFRYEALSLWLDGAPGGDFDVEITLRGTGPGLEGDGPATLEIAISAPLADLLRARREADGPPAWLTDDERFAMRVAPGSGDAGEARGARDARDAPASLP